MHYHAIDSRCLSEVMMIATSYLVRLCISCYGVGISCSVNDYLLGSCIIMLFILGFFEKYEALTKATSYLLRGYLVEVMSYLLGSCIIMLLILEIF